MDTRPPREIEHSQDEKENLELLVERRVAFLDGNIQSVQAKRDENRTNIESLEKAIEGNALLIENLKNQKNQALEVAMQSQEKGLTIAKPHMFERFTRFFSDRFNPSRTIQTRVLNPFKTQIATYPIPGVHEESDKTEEEEQNEFVKNVQQKIADAKEKYSKPVEKIHAFVKAQEEAVKKVAAIGTKVVEEKTVSKKGFEEEIIV